MITKKKITFVKNSIETKSRGKVRFVLNTLRGAGAEVTKLSKKELLIDASNFKNSKGIKKAIQSVLRGLGMPGVAFIMNEKTFANPKDVRSLLSSWQSQKKKIYNEEIDGETEIIVVVPEGAVDAEIIATATAITDEEAKKVSDGIKEGIDEELAEGDFGGDDFEDGDDVDFTDLDDVDLDEDDDDKDKEA